MSPPITQQAPIIESKKQPIDDGDFKFTIDKQLFDDLIGIFGKINRFFCGNSKINRFLCENQKVKTGRSCVLTISSDDFHGDQMTGYRRLFIHTFAKQLGLYSARGFQDPQLSYCTCCEDHSHESRTEQRRHKQLSTSMVHISREPFKLSPKNLKHRRLNAKAPHYINIIRVAELISLEARKITPLFVVWLLERKKKSADRHILAQIPKDVIKLIDSFAFGGQTLLKFLLSKSSDKNSLYNLHSREKYKFEAPIQTHQPDKTPTSDETSSSDDDSQY
jgi:hypothetical protein